MTVPLRFSASTARCTSASDGWLAKLAVISVPPAKSMQSEMSCGHRDDAGDDDDQGKREEEVAPADDVEPADAWLGDRLRSCPGVWLRRSATIGGDVRPLLFSPDVRHF